MPTYNHHQNTQIVSYLLILPSFHNKPGSTEAEWRTGKPKVTGSNLTDDYFFFSLKNHFEDLFLRLWKWKKKILKKKKIEKKKKYEWSIKKIWGNNRKKSWRTSHEHKIPEAKATNHVLIVQKLYPEKFFLTEKKIASQGWFGIVHYSGTWTFFFKCIFGLKNKNNKKKSDVNLWDPLNYQYKKK